MHELFYELRNDVVIIYDSDGGLLPREERHLRYQTQATLPGERTSGGLADRINRAIAEKMERVAHHVRHREKHFFEFTATPFSTPLSPPLDLQMLPVITGKYRNLRSDHYDC